MSDNRLHGVIVDVTCINISAKKISRNNAQSTIIIEDVFPSSRSAFRIPMRIKVEDRYTRGLISWNANRDTDADQGWGPLYEGINKLECKSELHQHCSTISIVTFHSFPQSWNLSSTWRHPGKREQSSYTISCFHNITSTLLLRSISHSHYHHDDTRPKACSL